MTLRLFHEAMSIQMNAGVLVFHLCASQGCAIPYLRLLAFRRTMAVYRCGGRMADATGDLSSQRIKPASAQDWLPGDDEMSCLIRDTDWASTPLGPLANWPQSLRTTVSLCLASNFPINIIWGSEHTQIYNAGYRI